MFKKYNQKREIARAMFLYISYSILGPLLVMGAIGYFVDKFFSTKFFLFLSLFIAYIISNFLMFKKLKKLNKEIEKIPFENKKDDPESMSKNKYDDDDDYNEKWPVKSPNTLIEKSDSQVDKIINQTEEIIDKSNN